MSDDIRVTQFGRVRIRRPDLQPEQKGTSVSEDLKNALRRIRQNRHEEGHKLLERIKAALPDLEALLTSTQGEWGIEDKFYRFYHHSFKVFNLKGKTADIVTALDALKPEGGVLNSMFLRIIEEGRQQRFQETTNANWMAETRPVLEAFFHARHFLEMVVKYGKELDEPPAMLPTGWAAVLTLYGLR